MSDVPPHIDRLVTLTDDLAEALDGALIGVGYHRDGDWESIYMRPDFADRFSDEDQELMANKVILDGLLKTAEETVWGFGSMRFKLLSFDDAHVAHIPCSDREGIAVGVDAVPLDEFESAIEPVIEYCHE